jgi:hypothetical protein
MAYISFQPSDHFNTKLYTGNGSTNAITGVGFQPDWVWIKNRTQYSHQLYDAVRGVTKRIFSNNTDAEETDAQGLTTFGSDGFSLGTNAGVNQSSTGHVSWNWKANGSGSANTDGDITSTVSANTTSGFSIIKFTGNSSTSQSFGHGLSGTPKMWFIKNITDSGDNWQVYFNNTTRLKLDTTEVGESNYLMTANATTITTPSNSGGAWGNANGKDFIVYAFQEIKGFSAMNSYTGNNNVDGNFLYTGFKPAFIMIKRTNFTKPWMMFDNKRDGYNPDNNQLQANDTAVEATNDFIDIVSNGFKIRTTDSTVNTSGGVFIYMAFAEAPLVSSNGIPAVAR